MYYTDYGILQARILEWVAIPFSRGSSWPKNWTRSPALQVVSLPTELSGKPADSEYWLKLVITVLERENRGREYAHVVEKGRVVKENKILIIQVESQ